MLELESPEDFRLCFVFGDFSRGLLGLDSSSSSFASVSSSSLTLFDLPLLANLVRGDRGLVSSSECLEFEILDDAWTDEADAEARGLRGDLSSALGSSSERLIGNSMADPCLKMLLGGIAGFLLGRYTLSGSTCFSDLNLEP